MPNHHPDHPSGGHVPHIGMRKVKSLLAIVIAFLLWQLVRLFFPELEVHPIFMYIYSMIEIRDSSEKTVTLGKRRIKATFTALGVGLPTLALLDLVLSRANGAFAQVLCELTLMLLGVLLTLEVAEAVGCQNLCGLSAAVFIVLYVTHADSGRYVYSLLRALQTVAGVAVAWVVNVKLFPYPGKPPETHA